MKYKEMGSTFVAETIVEENEVLATEEDDCDTSRMSTITSARHMMTEDDESENSSRSSASDLKQS